MHAMRPSDALFAVWFADFDLARGGGPLIDSTLVAQVRLACAKILAERPLYPSRGCVLECSQDDDGTAGDVTRIYVIWKRKARIWA